MRLKGLEISPLSWKWYNRHWRTTVPFRCSSVWRAHLYIPLVTPPCLHQVSIRQISWDCCGLFFIKWNFRCHDLSRGVSVVTRPIFDITLRLSLHSPKKGLSCSSRSDNYFPLIPPCQSQSQPSIEARDRTTSHHLSVSFLLHLPSSICFTSPHSLTSRAYFPSFCLCAILSFLFSMPSKNRFAQARKQLSL